MLKIFLVLKVIKCKLLFPAALEVRPSAKMCFVMTRLRRIMRMSYVTAPGMVKLLRRLPPESLLDLISEVMDEVSHPR